MSVNEKLISMIREAGFFFYATTEDGKPRVRPLGYIDNINGKMVIAISTVKAMSKQTLANPEFEICASTSEQWVRFSGKALPLDDAEIIEKMLECPILKGRFTPETVGAFELDLDKAEYFSMAGAYEKLI